ncbi:MAG: PTS sugar transporter subunit IIA [Candidatus Aminicenantes bacterium]|jgi:PTS system nitrogen regulatory IIA component|nr:PTS sugar transporter subunit IIA [Candidatus Aminicenantes bacterium]MDH5383107.1 PTS sugar transporter subunit IIA [Candidatus Aminicenantes bacterium]MDH5744207.1 PTS sugar transporter subunit IIA [Candidatus Aminicenantes bacterium]
MKICSILKENHVFLDLKSRDKRQVLEEFVAAIKEKGLISDDKLVLDELLKRESLGSTGLEKGIAIPHALIDELKEPFLAIAVIKAGTDFEAADQMPTYILMLLLGNKNNPGAQLKILAHVCRLVKETDFIEKIKKINEPNEICAILEEEEGKII